MNKVYVYLFSILLLSSSFLIANTGESQEIDNGCNNFVSSYDSFLDKSSVIDKNIVLREKLDNSLYNLVSNSKKTNEIIHFKLESLNFVENMVRIEIILSDVSKIQNLKSCDVSVKIENSYENIVQALVPVDEIKFLSQKDFIDFIRKPIICQPSVLSEGVGVIGADQVHNSGYYGDGSKVAIIDFGFTGYDTNPEIPIDQIVESKSYRSGYDIDEGGIHGSACTELVADVAPNASLYLYSCGTISEFDDAVDRAISKNVDIISFSAGWKGINNYDGTGYACDIVNNARAHDILFIVSAGNEAEHHYEGFFSDPDNDYYHNFHSSDEGLSLGYLSAGTYIDLTLSWNDWPHSDQDFDLYLCDSDGYVVGSSFNVQDGSQPPYEHISGYISYGYNYFILIEEYSSSESVYFELYGNSEVPFLEYNHPESSIASPADASGAFTTGATYWSDDNLESFSSRGPTNDGRVKPDIVSPDGVSTYSYGPGNFYGTSASSPHAAGAAALLKSADSSLNANMLQNKLESTALDLGSSGKDNSYGSGRIDVWAAFNTVNQVPIAYDDCYTVNEDNDLFVSEPGVLSNDYDFNGDPLTATLVSDVSYGALTLNSDGSFVYSPDINYNGSDSFEYKAFDGEGYSNVAEALININEVNDAPIVDDIPNQTVEEGSTFSSIFLDDYVSDVEDSDSEIVWTYSGNSDLIVTIDNHIANVTIPDDNWNDQETIVFNATDSGGLSDSDEVVYTVDPLNDPPQVYNIPNQTIDEGESFASINLDDYVSDVEDSDSEIVWSYSENQSLDASIVDRVATITIPDEDWNGQETITFTATDTGGLSDSDDIIFTVESINDPPVANDDSAEVDEDSSVLIDVLSNDSDVEDGIPMLKDITVQPEHGTASIEGDMIRYTPHPNFSGMDSFTYRVNDSGGLTDTALVTIQVINLNDAPVANNDSTTVDEGKTITINVSDNDLDIDDGLDLSSIIIKDNPDHGSVFINNDGTVDYFHDGGELISDKFDYTIKDISGSESNKATVFITINQINDPPVANDDFCLIYEDSIDNQIDVLANDSDVEGDDLEIINVSIPSEGSVFTDGDYVYFTPNPDFSGNDSFYYNISDGKEAYDNATVYLTIEDVNDPPVSNFTYIPLNPKVNESIEFFDISNDIDGYVKSYNWDFGDGNVSNLQNPVHNYSNPGVYNVTLTVQDDGGQEDSITEQIVVKNVFYNITGKIYNDGLKNGSIYVYLIEDELTIERAPVQTKVYSSESNYSFQVTNGTYYIASFIDVNNDGQPQMISEPIGLAVNKTSYEIDDATPINVNGEDEVNNDITFYRFFNVSGTISYYGEENGSVYLFEQKTNRPIIQMSNVSFPALYNFSIYNGTYQLGAYIDSNNNMKYDSEEPIGFAFNQSSWSDADDISVDGENIDNINITIYDSSLLSNVYVDDDYDENTNDWQYDHFNSIDKAVNIVAENGSIFVNNGSYYENILIDKPLDLIGENKNTTSIDGLYKDYTINIESDFVDVSGFSIINGDNCVKIWSADNCSVFGNIILNHTQEGIRVDNSYNDKIIGNRIESSDVDKASIQTEGSAGINISDNKLFKGGIFLLSTDNIIENNTINGEPVVCLENDSDRVFDENVGQLIVINCNNISIKNQSFSNTILGIELFSVSNSSISDSNFTNNGGGAILLGSNNNSIKKNNFVESYYGINVAVSNNNTLTENYIAGNDMVGIRFDDFTKDNIIYNNFFNNSFNANDSGENRWDNGSIGNYWSDYNGTDTDDDGVGETDYMIPGGSNVDHYPLGLFLPIANFTYIPVSPSEDKTVFFNASDSYDPDGEIVNYYWDFGDGNTETGQSLEHVFSSSGVFKVTLTVVDEDGRENKLAKNITIDGGSSPGGGDGGGTDDGDDTPPTPPPDTGGGGGNDDDSNYNPPDPNEEPVADADGPYYEIEEQPIFFNASTSIDSDGEIVEYHWEFGDGSTGYGLSISHIYTESWNYTVNLTVKDNDGDTGFYQTYAVVTSKPNIPPANPLIKGKTFLTLNKKYSFSVYSYNDDNESLFYNLSWGDGRYNSTTKANGTYAFFNHSWNSRGIYTLTVNVTDESNASSIETMLVYVDVFEFLDNKTIDGYLLDEDYDGIYDSFHNNQTGETIILGFENNTYLIDLDNDGTWDYNYSNGKLEAYSEKKSDEQEPSEEDENKETKEEDNLIPGFEILFIIFALMVLIFWRKRKK